MIGYHWHFTCQACGRHLCGLGGRLCGAPSGCGDRGRRFYPGPAPERGLGLGCAPGPCPAPAHSPGPCLGPGGAHAPVPARDRAPVTAFGPAYRTCWAAAHPPFLQPPEQLRGRPARRTFTVRTPTALTSEHTGILQHLSCNTSLILCLQNTRTGQSEPRSSR